MSIVADITPAIDPGPSPRQVAESLVSVLAERAARHDAEDSFVGDNYALLREAGLVEAGVPAALGGGGAGPRELAEMLRVLAHGCGSTALAFSMHTHQVAIPAWRWTHRQVAAVEPLLRRVAGERLVFAQKIVGSRCSRKCETIFPQFAHDEQ